MKKIILSFLVSLTIITNSLAAGSSNGGDTKSKYDQAVKFIEAAKKNEKKGKKDKAQSNYEKALKLLVKSNKEKPNKADTLNYLGFTSRKLGDFENGEKYYLEGLAIDPNHIGINEYLGELYVATNRHNLAVERLEV
jgi:Flp pilus assembly protein TadD, contains TPR repeats